MTIDGHNERHASARLLAILGVAVVGSILLARLLLGAPTTERVQPPSPVAPPTLAATSETTAQGAPSDAPAAPVPALPTPLAIPLADSSSIPAASDCDRALPGDPDIEQTTLIDLDDGALAAIGAVSSTGQFSDLIEFQIYADRTDCDWVPMGRLLEGFTRDVHDNIVNYSWTCSTGLAGSDLVQISTRTFPEPISTIQHLTFEDGVLVRHQPSTVDTDLMAERPRSEACGVNSWRPASVVEAHTCGGRNWTLELPDDWKTPVIGQWSCAWFDQRAMGLPCQCDAIPPISIELMDEPAAGFEVLESTVIDTYPARLATRSFLGMGNGPTTERAYLIDLGAEFLVLRASDGEWTGSWEDLSDALDQFAAAIDIVGVAIPTMEMRHPDFPFVASSPMYVDPAANFAWYPMQDPAEGSTLATCGGEGSVQLARLTIPGSELGHLDFSPARPLPAGQLATIQGIDAGSALVTIICSADAGNETRYYEAEFESDGTITRFSQVDAPQNPWPRPRYFASTPDGRFRYASGHDPLGRIDTTCGASTGSDPDRAQTLLRYESATATPAFRDNAITGEVRNMRITDSGIVVWESHHCQSVELHIGRIDADGYIIDRFELAGNNDDAYWTLTAEGALTVLRPSRVEVDEFVDRLEDGQFQNGYSATFPDLLRLDLASPATHLNSGLLVQAD